LRPRRFPDDWLLPATVALTLFVFACGSSGVAQIARAGRPIRWAMLLLLVAAAARWAAGAERRVFSPRVVATAACFVGLAALSAAWSVAPRLTLERAATLVVLAVAAALVAAGARGRSERVLGGLVGGGVLVGLAGLLILALRHHNAVQAATTHLPARYQGLGQNPDTASLQLALLVAPALWLGLRAPSRRGRLAALAALALFAGSIVASGSHGAIAGGAVGAAVVAVGVARSPLRFVALFAAIVVAVGAGAWVETLPKPNPQAPPVKAGPTAPPSRPGYIDAEVNFPLDGELGIPLPGALRNRQLLTSSGRTQAWGGAIHQAERRPVAGYGFGTEARVFVDRWSTFTSALPEESYIGIALQLGAAGLIFFLIFVLAVFSEALPSFRVGSPATACAAVVAAGLVIGLVQSYIYSVGNVGAVPWWLAAFLVPAAAA
jgi:O-antigen ligase